MIRVFGATDTEYTTNGDGVIIPIKARVKNNDNGDFYFEMTCGAEYNNLIEANNILVVNTPQGDQAFRIRDITKNKNRLEVKAWHLYYDSNNYLIADSYAVDMTAKQALEHFNSATDNTSPFTMDSNILTINNQRIVRGSLNEAVTAVIERWGGHLRRDNFNIIVDGTIGQDHGITIEYKKNLQEMTATYDWSGVCTKCLPVGKDGLLLDELYVYSTTQYSIPFTKSVTFEQEIEREDYPDEESYILALQNDLRSKATDYLAGACTPSVNYTLKGKPEKVADIGDIIEVKDSRIGVDVMTSVISYEYDAIQDKYIELEFGNFTPSLNGLFGNIKTETNLQISTATQGISIELGEITNNIVSLQSSVNTLSTDKQDVLTAGSHMSLAGNVADCILTSGDGVSIGSDDSINLAPIGAYEYKGNEIVTITTSSSDKVATLYIQLPRPIDTYTIGALELTIYKTGTTTVSLTDQTAGITITPAKESDYTLSVTITDTQSTLSNLEGAYPCYIDMTINQS